MTITLEDLNEYQKLKERIDVLKREREAVYTRQAAPADVRGGRASARTASDPTASKVRDLLQFDERLMKKQAELEDRARKIFEWSASIPDTEVGAIIRIHYISGRTWEQTCSDLYGYSDRQYCKRKVKRYFEKLNTLYP